MDRPARGALRLPGLAAALVIALALPALAAPARAADPDVTGWFAALDLAETQPNSLDQHYANQLDTTVPPPRSPVRRLAIDNSSHLAWRGSVGYGFGRGFGSLQASYWTFDHDDEDRRTITGTSVSLYPTLFPYGANYGYASGQPFVITKHPIDVRATSKVKAKTVDVDYVRPLVAGDVLAVKWLTGLRSATFEEDQGFEGMTSNTVGPTTYTYTYLQKKHLKSDAAGIRFGLTTVFGFSKHFALEGGMTFSFLQARIDERASQERVDMRISDSMKVSSHHVRGEIREIDARAVWSYGPVDYYVGYGGAMWDGLVADLISGPASVDEIDRRSRDSISFSSARAGVVWRFGKR